MDKYSKFQALAGESSVINQGSANWFPPNVKAKNIYEGTDSEDDEIVTSKGRVNTTTGSMAHKNGALCVDTSKSFGFNLVQGQKAPEGIKFMTFKSAVKYPYQFIGQGNRQKVAEGFFDKHQVYGHTYDLFYLYPVEADYSPLPIILIPTKQFEALLVAINSKLKTQLTIPNGPAGDAFYIGFWDDGNPVPRYLGRSDSKEIFDTLKLNVPPYYYKPDGKPDGEPTGVGKPDARSLADFREKVALMTASEKSKKGAAKAKKTLDQAQRYQASRDIVKRVQTYIGIRKPDDGIEAALFKAHESRVEWYDPKAIAAAVSREATAKFGPATFFDAGKPMKFTPEDSVVFISVDVEANEFNHREITEIGVATLDTLDLVQLVPGKGGENWMKQIRARHFRINEYRHVINRVHVSGCPGSFEFGKSEFINLANAPAAIASCFKAPFSGADTTSLDQDMPKRNIVLVGHSIGADIAFLRDMGYDVTNLANLINTVDTGDMWKYVKKVTNPANLGSVLQELGMIGWNLHNAGNDAVYTLQVMIGLAIKHVQDKGKSKVVFPTENKFGEDNLAITRTTNASGWEIDEEDAQVAAAHEALKQLPLPEDDDDDDEWGFQNPTGVPWSTEYISYLDDGAQPGGLQEPLVPSSTVATLQQEDSDDAPSTTPDLVMTEQEALDFVMNAPWGDEGALMEQLGKIRLAPSQ